MYQLIKRRLIPDFDQTSRPDVRLRYGTVAGALGIASNLGLFSLKLSVGLLAGSVSIVADAINNLSDAGSSIVTLLGFRLSSRPADAEHPFGHARYEYISGFVVAFAVLTIGILLGKSSIEKIISPEPIAPMPVTLALLAAAIGIKLWQAGLYRDFGRAIGSSALLASAADSRNDMLATASVLCAAAAAFVRPGLTIDGFMGLGVSLFIVLSSLKLVKETLDPLLGTSPDPETVSRLTNKVLSYEGVLGIHDLLVHNYGPASRFATIHAEVDASVDILKSHDLIDNIERDVFREFGIFLVIHMDPVVTGDVESDALKAKVLEAVRAAAGDSVTIHDFRLVRGETHTNVLFDALLPFGSPWNKASLEAMLHEKFSGTDQTTAGHTWYFVITIDQDFSGCAGGKKPDGA